MEAVEVAGSGAPRARIYVAVSICIVIGLFATVGYLALAGLQKQRTYEASVFGARTLKGQVVCLSQTGSGPHTMECALGLETSQGAYMLKDLDMVRDGLPAVGRTVVVTGEVVPRSEGDSQYAIVGGMRVSSVK